MELKGENYERSKLENNQACTESKKRQRPPLCDTKFRSFARSDEGVGWFKHKIVVVL